MKTKKSLLISTLIFLAAGFSGIPKEASALVEKDGVTYWTFEEMLELDAEINREKLEVCGADNYDCEWDFEMNLMERGGQYLVYDMFNFQQMFMTAVNPAKNTIKFFYRDEDKMMRMFGIDEKYPLEEFIVFWTDDEIEKSYPGELLRGFRHYIEPMLNGESVDDLHPIFFGNVELNGENWFEPNKELGFTIVSDDTKDNTKGFFYQMGKSNGTFSGRIYYSDCINSADYEDGMECRLFFGGTPETLRMTYFPFREEDEEEKDEEMTEMVENEEITEIIKDEEIEASEEVEMVEKATTEEIIIEEIVSEMEASGEMEFPKEVNEKTGEVEKIKISESVVLPKEAKSGKETVIVEEAKSDEEAEDIEIPFAAAKIEKTDDFPWGIAALCTVGTIYIAWWLLPIEKITKNLNFFQKKC